MPEYIDDGKVWYMSHSIPPTTTEESAVEHAEIAAQQADQSAVAATAAAINQGQLIETVTAAAREDAERARSAAEQSADESKSAAELSTIVAETSIAQMNQLMQDYDRRLSALESKREEPVQMIGPESVAPINPEETEQSARQEDMSEEGGTSSSSKKRHGRRRRS